MLFEGQGQAKRFAHDSRLVGKSAVWRSITPYLHPWSRKWNFDVPKKIRRECQQRSRPEPVSFTLRESIAVSSQERRPVHFHRFRSKRGLVQPDTRGDSLELRFAEPLRGPLALGYGCRYGLGLFVAVAGEPE